LIGIETRNIIDANYLFAFFERFDLRSLQDITPVPQLNKNDVEKIMLPYPEIAEQIEIAKIVGVCDSKIAALDNEARLHQELFRAMLEELMSGRLPAGALVKDAAGEEWQSSISKITVKFQKVAR